MRTTCGSVHDTPKIPRPWKSDETRNSRKLNKTQFKNDSLEFVNMIECRCRCKCLTCFWERAQSECSVAVDPPCCKQQTGTTTPSTTNNDVLRSWPRIFFFFQKKTCNLQTILLSLGTSLYVSGESRFQYVVRVRRA